MAALFIAQINAGFDAVGYAGPDLTWDPLEDTKDFFSIINGDTLVFDEALIGINFIAVHFGSAGGGGGAYNQTLFFQFNFAEATTQVDLNRLGYSNAIGAFSTPPEVPGTGNLGDDAHGLRRRGLLHASPPQGVDRASRISWHRLRAVPRY